MILPQVEVEGKTSVESMIARVARLPVQGTILPKLQRMLSEPDSNGDEVLNMIKLDPGLIGRVLRRSNSVAFATGYRIGSIEEAVARIGYREVNRLLLESVTHRLLARPLRCYGLASGAIWRASLVCAFAMEMLAKHTRRSEDTAYTLGLLHAVGMIVISHEMEAENRSRPLLGNPFENGLGERERERFGHDHAEIGAELLKFWEFPESMIEAVRFQLSPTLCKTTPKLACLLALARWVRNRICAETGWGDPEPPDPFLMKLAALEEEELNQICVVAEERLDAAESLAAGW